MGEIESRCLISREVRRFVRTGGQEDRRTSKTRRGMLTHVEEIPPNVVDTAYYAYRRQDCLNRPIKGHIPKVLGDRESTGIGARICNLTMF